MSALDDCRSHLRHVRTERDKLKERVTELEEDSKRTWGLHTEEESRRYKAEHERDQLKAQVAQPAYDLVDHLYRQMAFSDHTFGPGDRVSGLLAHIRKELVEIEKSPKDVTEWIDVVLLALDGAWRSGHSPTEIAEALAAKQSKNENRKWPDWRKVSPGTPIEHVKTSSDKEPQ